ncbi:MAG: lysophospholipid acyltransferase family protein [Deltaproteobacteria bacterium]|nr:lysophospholipid acyltransferase family protein [Deltaproteobacteria bacterium]
MARNLLRDKLLFSVVPWLAKGVICFLWSTMRTEVLGEEHPREFWNRGVGIIFSLWHEQLLMMAKVYRGPGLKSLVSSSKDGEIFTNVLRVFNYGAVRGSSSRHGMAALKEMVRECRSGTDLAITPDGPKGPRHEVKPGIAQLARLSGSPIILMSFACSRGHRFASWDRFVLPYPFSTGVFCYSRPYFPEQGEDAESFRLRIQQGMEENQLKAVRRLEELGVSAI